MYTYYIMGYGKRYRLSNTKWSIDFSGYRAKLDKATRVRRFLGDQRSLKTHRCPRSRFVSTNTGKKIYIYIYICALLIITP